MCRGSLLLDDSTFEFPRVIAFFGPDGAGKSTQAELMVEYLESGGFKVKKAWVRSVHTFAYLLWNLFMKLNLRRERGGIPVRMRTRFAVSYINEKPYGVVSPITMTPPALNGATSHRIWSTIEVISILPVILLQVYIPLMLGYVVVAERYVVDSIASIAYFMDDENFAKGRLAKFLLKFIPKGTFFVFIDADYQTIFSRRGEMAGTSDYTEFHRQIYMELAHVVGAVRFDTSKLFIQETHQKVVNFILRQESFRTC